MFDLDNIFGNKKAITSINIPQVRIPNASSLPPQSNRLPYNIYSWKRYKWSKNNVLKGVVPNYSGIYAFFDYNGSFLYVGHSKMLRHRIQSYYQDDCFNEHPTKKRLRPLIYSFTYRVMPYMKARTVEKKLKNYSKFNYL